MLALVALVCIVGFTEELMFRGIGVVTFRRMHLTEGKVALYSSVAFGAVHLSNALSTGTTAIFQAIVVSFTGYLLYLTRRWAGVIWLAMPVHGSQDFLISSGQLGIDPEVSPLSFIVFPTMIGLGILLWRRRHQIDTEADTASESPTGPAQRPRRHQRTPEPLFSRRTCSSSRCSRASQTPRRSAARSGACTTTRPAHRSTRTSGLGINRVQLEVDAPVVRNVQAL